MYGVYYFIHLISTHMINWFTHVNA